MTLGLFLRTRFHSFNIETTARDLTCDFPLLRFKMLKMLSKEKRHPPNINIFRPLSWLHHSHMSCQCLSNSRQIFNLYHRLPDENRVVKGPRSKVMVTVASPIFLNIISQIYLLGSSLNLEQLSLQPQDALIRFQRSKVTVMRLHYSWRRQGSVFILLYLTVIHIYSGVTLWMGNVCILLTPCPLLSVSPGECVPPRREDP